MFEVTLSLLQKMLLSLAVGAILGLEREHSKRQTILGIRTFSLISITGLLLTELSKDYYYIASSIGLVGIFALALFFYFFRATHLKNALGLTTVMMLPLTYVLGMLISANFILESIAATVIIAYVLIEKGEVHHLVEMISRREIVDFLIFSVIAFVIYPLIPSSSYAFLGWKLNPQSFVLSVILISFLSFVSHVIVRVIKHNAVLYASFFGGLISSLATVMLFARDKKVTLDALKLSFTSSSAGSILRDALLLVFINLPLFRSSAFIFLIPIVAFLFLTQYYSKGLKLENFKFIYNEPISLSFVLKFAGVLFAVTAVTSIIATVSPGPLFYISMLAAGGVNSASVIASVAFLFTSGALPESVAINSIFLGLLGSALSKLAITSNKSQWGNSKSVLLLICLSLVFLIAGYFASLNFTL
ncbi:MgtC/SapB family protein [Candidatus Micrarchaeota archaeon]|nr:MgtC/SapB family protein [Candidatus Micrarchaeota archaeon]